ncbi:MAG: insulinase family protein [Woeseiaceae bacterium]|nr:insulinase family protein [Woeseiaceae bacterium]
MAARRLTAVVIAAAWLLTPLPASAALELHDVRRYTLDNGLTVLLLEDRNFPVVSVQMLYRVGARNEVGGKTGLAHFVEHMAFRATERFPDTGVVSRIYAVGGEWHGYTWTDQTTYFATVPREHRALLLDIEADRLSRLVIDPAAIEAEQGAVLAEMRLYETSPTSQLIDAVASVSFLVHPYRHNTIGWESDVRRITAEDVRAFYEAHYHPGNAVLAVVGDFDAPELRARIEALFAGGDRRPATPLPHSDEPAQSGERRVVIRGPTAGRQFAVAYRAPGVTHPDFPAFLVLQEVLAGGSGVNFLQNDWGTPARDGRPLHGAAGDVTTWFPPSEMDYLFVIGGRIDEDATEADAEQAIEAEIATLRTETPETRTLDDAIDNVLDELVYDVQTTEDAAHQLAFFAGFDALDVLLTLPDRVRSVTAADVRRVARSWLRPQARSVAWYRGSATRPIHPAPATTSAPDVPAPGPVDETPADEPELRRLDAGLPAVVAASDLSSSVFLKLVVAGTVAGRGFAADDPEPGFSSWNGLGRPGELQGLVADAANALGAADRSPPTRASSSDPATRLAEEFAAIIAASLPAADGPLHPHAVVVAGDVDRRAAFAMLQGGFGEQAPARVVATERDALPRGHRTVSVDSDAPQAQLGYIVAAPAPGDAGYPAWRILQYLFAHDYEGRFGKAAISGRGLAYYVDARYASAGGPGWTTFAVGVDPDKLPALEQLMRAELERFATEPPSAAEIADAKRHLRGRAVSAAQSNEEIATRLARHFVRHGRLPPPDASEPRYDDVTNEDLERVLSDFANGLTITVLPRPEPR